MEAAISRSDSGFYSGSLSDSVILQHDDGTAGYTFSFLAAGTLVWSVDGSSATTSVSRSGFKANTWNHVTATRKGDTFNLYTTVGNQSATSAVGSLSNTADVIVGGSSSSTDDFDDRIDDLRFYDRAINTVEAAELQSQIVIDTTQDIVDGTTTDVAALIANKGADGFISLREAILAANNDPGSGWILSLDAGTYSLTETGTDDNSGDFDVRSTITIQGAGAQDSIISTAISDRLFQITDGDLTLQGVTLQGGSSTTGGAVLVGQFSSLLATDTVFRDNTSSGSGGAITTQGEVTLNRVALIDNDATGSSSDGGAINILSGSTTLNNVTVSGNTAGNGGGGIKLGGGLLEINHSTIANNEGFSSSGGGLKRTSGTATISNSIFAGNRASFGGKDINGVIVSGGYNIIEDDNGAFTPATGDQQAVDPGLNALALVDGTFVHTFDTSSIAYDSATGSSETVDQRGVARDGNPDIGAYEFTVEDVNEAPVLDNSNSFFLTSIDEDDTNNGGNTVAEIIASQSGDRITDGDADSVEGIAIFSTGSTFGTWQYNTGSGWINVGSVSVSSSLLLGASDSIRFVPNGENGESATIAFAAWDQTTGEPGDRARCIVFRRHNGVQ